MEFPDEVLKQANATPDTIDESELQTAVICGMK